MRKIDIVYDLALIATWFAIIILGARYEQLNFTLGQVIEKQKRIELMWSDGGF